MNGNYGEQLTSSVDTTRTYSFSKTAKISGVIHDSTQLSLITAVLDPSATPKGQVVGVNKVKVIISAKKSRMQGLKP